VPTNVCHLTKLDVSFQHNISRLIKYVVEGDWVRSYSKYIRGVYSLALLRPSFKCLLSNTIVYSLWNLQPRLLIVHKYPQLFLTKHSFTRLNVLKQRRGDGNVYTSRKQTDDTNPDSSRIVQYTNHRSRAPFHSQFLSLRVVAYLVTHAYGKNPQCLTNLNALWINSSKCLLRTLSQALQAMRAQRSFTNGLT